MNIPFDIEKLVKNSSITNELDYECAMIADRKLRLLAKDSLYFKELRMQLCDLIEKYEKLEWNSAEELTEEKIRESEMCEHIAELERVAYKKTIV